MKCLKIFLIIFFVCILVCNNDVDASVKVNKGYQTNSNINYRNININNRNPFINTSLKDRLYNPVIIYKNNKTISSSKYISDAKKDKKKSIDKGCSKYEKVC